MTIYVRVEQVGPLSVEIVAGTSATIKLSVLLNDNTAAQIKQKVKLKLMMGPQMIHMVSYNFLYCLLEAEICILNILNVELYVLFQKKIAEKVVGEIQKVKMTGELTLKIIY